MGDISCSWRRRGAGIVLVVLLFSSIGSPSAQAKETQAYVGDAVAYQQKGDLKAAEIELRNAVRDAPQDPRVRARLAEVLLRRGDARGAEREARAARDLNGDEADYLPVLADSLLRQRRFVDVQTLVVPGDDRPAELESKVRMLLASAEIGLHDPSKAESLLRDAVRLDPGALLAKLALARLLLGTNVDEAETLADQLIGTSHPSAAALQIKGEVLRARGDDDAALHTFEQAVTLDPNNIPARLSRANLYLSRNDFKGADDDLGIVLTMSPNNFQANYLRALEFAKRRNFVAADKLLERLSPAFFDFVNGLYLQGAVKYGLGQREQAEALLTKYVARVPNSARGARLLALIAMGQGAPGRASGYLTAYLGKSPADAATLTLLGNAYMADKKPALALQQYEKAAALEPQNPTIKTKVAVSEIGSGQGQKGLAELEELFGTSPDGVVAGPALVLTELRAGHTDKADGVVEALVKRDGGNNNPLHQTLLGLVRLAQHDYPSAEVALKSAVAREPDFPAATANLAQLYLATGRADEAKKAYRDLLLRKRNDLSSLLGLADIAVSQKQWDEAIGYLDEARSVAPDNPMPGLKAVDIYALRQDWSRASALATALVARFPSNIQILEVQGRVQFAAGDREAAIDTYRRANELAPKSAPIALRYIALLAAAKKFPEEQKVLQAQLVANPGSARIKAELIGVEAEIGGLEAGLAKAHALSKDDPNTSLYDIMSAKLYEKSGRIGEAVAVLEKVAAARPSDSAPTLALAQVYRRLRDPAKAQTVLADRLRDDPDNVAVRSALAALYLDTKQYDVATAEYSRLNAQRPNDPVVLNNLAWLNLNKGDLTKARELAERALAITPTAGPVEDTLGWILLAQGDPEKSLTYLKEASAAVPGNPEIQYHYAAALGRAGHPDDARTILESLLGSGVAFDTRTDAEKLLEQLKHG